MKTGIYKEVQIDTSHRLLHYKGKCANLHGHRWKVEVWMEGEPDPATQILIDYSLIKKVIGKYDHQIIRRPHGGLHGEVPARHNDARRSDERTDCSDHPR